MDEQRVYTVIDMKSFFASVECAERGLDALSARLVVADPSRTEKTICLAVTPAMKALGVRNRCRLFEIPKNIDYIIAPPRMKKYVFYAAEIYGIYLKYISKEDIHVYSIDECMIDITDYLHIYRLKAKDFVRMLMDEIKEKLKIPASAGIGTNLYLAKIALDITAKKSTDGIGWLTEEKFQRELQNHRPITDFWGISGGIANRLARHGVFDMKGITELNEQTLYNEFGVNAELIIDHAYGRETCLMKDIKNYKGKSKSLSNSQILPCDYSTDDAKNVLHEMLQEGCYRLAKSNMVATHVGIGIGYGDDRKAVASANVAMSVTTYLYSLIVPYADKLFDDLAERGRPIRKVFFVLSGLRDEKEEFFDLFTDRVKAEKEKRLYKSVLDMKEKFGKNSMLKGTDFVKNATQRERNEQIGGHREGKD